MDTEIQLCLKDLLTVWTQGRDDGWVYLPKVLFLGNVGVNEPYFVVLGKILLLDDCEGGGHYGINFSRAGRPD